MPAKSKVQQKAAGAALAAKRGDISPRDLFGASEQMYNSMESSDLEDFASTKHAGLPDKVKEEKLREYIKTYIKEILKEDYQNTFDFDMETLLADTTMVTDLMKKFPGQISKSNIPGKDLTVKLHNVGHVGETYYDITAEYFVKYSLGEKMIKSNKADEFINRLNQILGKTSELDEDVINESGLIDKITWHDMQVFKPNDVLMNKINEIIDVVNDAQGIA